MEKLNHWLHLKFDLHNMRYTPLLVPIFVLLAGCLRDGSAREDIGNRKDKADPPALVIEGGIGVIDSKNFEPGDFVVIYNANGERWVSFSFDDPHIRTKFPPDFAPMAVDIDNYAVVFNCAEILETKYAVFINDTAIKYIDRNDKLFEFYEWDDYILNGDVAIDVYGRNVYAQPDANSEMVVTRSDAFTPISMKDDWLEVEWMEAGSSNKRTGWLIWRKDGDLIVSFLR